MSYIYEAIRTRGFEPRDLEKYYQRLEALAHRVVASPLKFSREELRMEIAECLRRSGFSPTRNHAVIVRCHYYGDKDVELLPVEMLYDDFSVRAIRPRIGSMERVTKESILLENCSVKDELLEIHRIKNLHLNGDNSVTMWVTEDDEIVAIDGAPVVCVFENEIRFSESISGVEFQLAYNVVAESHRRVAKGAIRLSDLSQAKELLIVDYRGITAIAGWNDHNYMNITAEWLASRIGDVEKNQNF
ncbi:MAG: hypothetical protein E7141_00895 [Rikenellaceae bacterium]|nr:hypothetical protein [Rikenellaceae bacterium]